METDEKIGEAEIKFSGTTVISALVYEQDGVKRICTANAGDARAVLAYVYDAIICIRGS